MYFLFYSKWRNIPDQIYSCGLKGVNQNIEAGNFSHLLLNASNSSVELKNIPLRFCVRKKDAAFTKSVQVRKKTL